MEHNFFIEYIDLNSKIKMSTSRRLFYHFIETSLTSKVNCELAGIPGRACLPYAYGAGTVSYTHLDVYKRQQQGYGNGGYSAVPQNYPPQQGFGSSGPPPNTYYVKPSIVDITRANPEHLNPAYQQYLKRDEERISQGNYPQGRENFKHGAPLEPGKTNPNSKTGGKRFPGRSGATYNDAANR